MQGGLNYREMGERVRQRRRELKMTQEQLAEQVGVSVSFIGHIERAEKKPSAETIVSLCESLGVTADYLMRGQRHRCDQQRCVLYEEMRALFVHFGK